MDFEDLAFMPVSKLKKMLKVKGQRLILQNLETCSLRAKLAADGHWEGLKQLQKQWN